MSAINNPIFQDADKAREWLEGHLWPEGPVCGHCGTVNEAGRIVTRPGYYQCSSKECRKQFTVMVNTIFERSHIPLNKWLMAAFLLCASKKGISAHQMHRMLNISYKSTWFMMHRIREAMRSGGLTIPSEALGGVGKIVEADETFLGQKEGKTKKRGYAHKKAALSLIERGGEVRSFAIDKADAANIWPIIDKNLNWESVLMTDESAVYGTIGRDFKAHHTVDHGKKEWVRGDVHTNTLENYFSTFKRGMKGVYQHCKEKHLHRYLAEFDFRYNNRIALGTNDEARAAKLLKGVTGKRLTYRRTDASSQTQ